MTENKNKAFVLFVVAFMTLRLILMYLFTAIFQQGAYQFGVYNDVVMPLLLAMIFGYIFIYKRR